MIKLSVIKIIKTTTILKMNYIYQGPNNPYHQGKKDLLSKNYGTFPDYIQEIRNDIRNDIKNNIKKNMNNENESKNSIKKDNNISLKNTEITNAN